MSGTLSCVGCNSGLCTVAVVCVVPDGIPFLSVWISIFIVPPVPLWYPGLVVLYVL